MEKQVVFDEIYDIFGKNLVKEGFQSNKNKNSYRYLTNFGAMVFEIKFTKGKVVHLNFCFSEKSLEKVFLEIENGYRLLQQLPPLDVKKITRPVISITDWGDLLTLNNYDHKQFNAWIAFIDSCDDIAKIKATYDVIYIVFKNNFMKNLTSQEDLYHYICKKPYKNSSDYIYMLIIAKNFGQDLSDMYSAIKQDENFIQMIPVFNAEIEFAFDYLNS